jgi:hypothetical protein
LDYNLLYRWFVGLSPDDPVWDPTVFTKNRDRLLLGQIVTLLLPAITAAAQSGNLSIGGIISQAIAGGAGGAILTAVIGAIKNKVAA